MGTEKAMSVLRVCKCGKRYRVKDEASHKAIRCVGCGAVIPGDKAPQPGRGRETPAIEAPARTDDPSTWASRPGLFRVNYFKYFRSFPTEPLVCLGLSAVAAAAAVRWHWGLWFVAALPLLFNLLTWRRARWLGRSGDVNPGMVVSTRPYLVAVASDLTLADDPYPVVKIVRQPLGRMTGGPPEVGTRLATVASYYGTGRGDHWEDFMPEVVNLLTADENAIEQLLSRIEEPEWADLEERLRRLPKPYQPGLYPITEDEPAAENTARPIAPDRLEGLLDEFLPHDPEHGWYRSRKEIPARKLKNALAAYAPGVDGRDVLALGDTSAVGGAKVGCLLTPEALYYRTNDGQGRVPWTEVRGAEPAGGFPNYPLRLRVFPGKHAVIHCEKEFRDGMEALLNEVGELNEESAGGRS